MNFTPVATSVYADENMSATMSNAFSSKKRKRQSGEVALNISKRNSLAATNGNTHNLNGTAESYSDSSGDYASMPNDPTEDISNTAVAALTAHLNDEQGLSFGTSGAATDDRPLEDSFNMDGSMQSNAQDSPYGLGTYTSGLRDPSTPNKPAVGSEEWHKVRRDNHKEVERRRRETINEGINELAKIVPGNEKNKGSILQRAVTYINDLKASESLAEEKKAMEKSIFDQSLHELMVRNQTLKDRNDELEAKVAQKNMTIEDLKMKLAANGIDVGDDVDEDDD